LFVVTSEVGSLAHWLGLAEKDSPILRAFAARKSQAEQGIVAAEARWKPEVYAYGTYNMIRHYQTLIEPNWRAGVGASFTLFAREDRAKQVSAAREALRGVESQDGEARNRILTAVEAAFRKVLQAREQFALLESSLAATRENLRLRERGFDEGQATSLDINEARNARARAETARSLTAYQFVVALSELLEASGQKQALSQFIHKADVVLSP
jgi:outer membrane protein TolC